MRPDTLDTIFSALADPTRRAILARLSSGEASVSELGQPFELSQPAISKHLKVLEAAGLIARSQDAQRRPCRLDAAQLKAASAWFEPYRALWEQRPGRLERSPGAPARAASKKKSATSAKRANTKLAHQQRPARKR